MGFRDFPAGNDSLVDFRTRRSLTEEEKNKIDPTRAARLRSRINQQSQNIEGFNDPNFPSVMADQMASEVNEADLNMLDALSKKELQDEALFNNPDSLMQDDFDDIVNGLMASPPDEIDTNSFVEDTIPWYLENIDQEIKKDPEMAKLESNIKTKAVIDRAAANSAFVDSLPTLAGDRYAPRADAMLVDRLRAFRERRMGQTPSNQFTKLQMAQDKNDMDMFEQIKGKGGTKALQKWRMDNGKMGSYDPNVGVFYDDKMQIITDPRFYKKTSEEYARDALLKNMVNERYGKYYDIKKDPITGEWYGFDRKAIAEGRTPTPVKLGAFGDRFTTLDVGKMKGLQDSFDQFKKDGGDTKAVEAYNDMIEAKKMISSDNKLAQKLAFMQFVKTVETRLSDLDRDFYTGDKSVWYKTKNELIAQIGTNNKLTPENIRNAKQLIDMGIERTGNSLKRILSQHTGRLKDFYGIPKQDIDNYFQFDVDSLMMKQRFLTPESRQEYFNKLISSPSLNMKKRINSSKSTEQKQEEKPSTTYERVINKYFK